jgi:flagellar hook protein FlgE
VGLNLSALSQDNATSAVTSIAANGTPTGSLSSVDVSSTGTVTAVFSNGVTRTIAQVAVGTFANPDGLTSVSGDAYQSSTASGAFTLNTAGTGGAGTISPSNLESSTVDLSAEFTNMITVQRAYSASSKIITTADSMLQDLIAIIR